MAIKGLFDERAASLTRIFKYSLGYRDIKKRGAPTSVDYFRASWKRLEDGLQLQPNEQRKLSILKKQFEPQLKKAYQTDTPRRLDIVFAFEDMEKNFPYYLKKYNGIGELECCGDGGVFHTNPEDLTPEYLQTVGEENWGEIVRGSHPAYTDGRCRGEQCPHFQKKKCQIVGSLVFVDINIKPIGLIQIDTGSANSIKNIYQYANFVKEEVGRIRGVPLELFIAYEQVSPKTAKGNNVKTNVPFLKIALNSSMQQLQDKELEKIKSKEIEADLDVDEYDDEIAKVRNEPPAALPPIQPTQEKQPKSEHTDMEKETRIMDLIAGLYHYGYSEGKVNYLKRQVKTQDEFIAKLESELKRVSSQSSKPQELFN